ACPNRRAIDAPRARDVAARKCTPSYSEPKLRQGGGAAGGQTLKLRNKPNSRCAVRARRGSAAPPSPPSLGAAPAFLGHAVERRLELGEFALQLLDVAVAVLAQI